jgi:hypothetical protein
MACGPGVRSGVRRPKANSPTASAPTQSKSLAASRGVQAPCELLAPGLAALVHDARAPSPWGRPPLQGSAGVRTPGNLRSAQGRAAAPGHRHPREQRCGCDAQAAGSEARRPQAASTGCCIDAGCSSAGCGVLKVIDDGLRC